jgi:hypothetical protein
LLLGFEIERASLRVVPEATTLDDRVTVGRLAFDALAGDTKGTSMRSPEKARSARRSPELNFL